MGRSPCCDESSGLKKGPWTPEEDKKLIDYIATNGHGSWRSLPKLAGLNRCGKSCRLRWTNYLRPDIKRGKFSEDEERIIIDLHSVLGNKWSKIASHLPGRTDNEIKNFWNTYLRKKLLQMGIDPNTHKPRTDLNHLLNLSQLLSSPHFINSNYTNNITSPWENALKFQAEVTDQLVKIQLFQNLFQVMNNTSNNNSINYTEILQNSTNFLSPQNPSSFQGQVDHGTSMSLTDCHDIQNYPTFVPCKVNGSNETKDIDEQKSWTLVEGSDARDGFENSHLENKGMIISSSDQETIKINEDTNPLPALVSEPSPRTNYQMKNDKSRHESSSTIFEAWDKLVDDDQTNESYWKDILELMSESPKPFSR